MTTRQNAIVTWGVLGVTLIVAQAVVRLLPIALEPLRSGELDPWQAVLYAAWAGFNAHAEGYRGFQRRFSPRVVARAIHLAQHPTPLRIALAPLFCMGFFHAKRRVLITTWGLFFGISLVVVLVRQVDQPWRGIIDGGVVVGLVWGLLSLVVFYVGALRGDPPPASPDLPTGAEGVGAV